MKYIAKTTIESLTSNFKGVKIDELLLALMSLQTKDRLVAMDFIRNGMERSVNKLLHNLYVFFLAQSEEKKHADELLGYLDQREQLQKRNQAIYLDRDFALNVCKYFDRTEAQTRIYGMLELYVEAVKLAVKRKNYELAKKYATMPSDLKTQKKLWLEIAKAVLQDYNADNKSGLDILNESSILTLGDLLPFVSAKVKLSTFRTDLLSSLQNYGSKINKIKKDMAELNKCFQDIIDQVQEAKNTFVPVPKEQCCEKCRASILGGEKVYIFSCMHSFHKVLRIRIVTCR